MSSFASKKKAGLKKLAPVISCHSFNWDRSMCAICPNSNKVKIYSGCHDPDVTKWELAYDLSSEHTMLVSGIDWSPVTNKIVTCSHDRNAFVWTYNDDSAVWEPSLVILRKYSKRHRSNVAVIIVKVIFINAFLSYCLLSNHSFPTDPNRMTNCFQLLLFLLQLVQLYKTTFAH